MLIAGLGALGSEGKGFFQEHTEVVKYLKTLVNTDVIKNILGPICTWRIEEPFT